jgi:AcrR family transcriptional regulator
MKQAIRSQRWQRRKDARPAELLEAALDVFFEKGFAAARLEDIAARAGVSKGTIYLYFESKDDVFEALVRSIPLPNIEQLRALAADKSIPADVMLRRVLTFLGGVLRDERMTKFPRLVIGEGGRFPKLAETYKREVISRGVAIIGAIVERGIEEGRFRDINPQHAAFAAISPVLFTAIWHTTFERFDSAPLDAQAFVAQHIDAFLRGITVGSEP